MTSLKDIGKRRTGLALSTLTALVLMIGYAGVQWLEGNWQPTSLDLQSPTVLDKSRPQDVPQPLVLHPRAPDGAVPDDWERSVDQSPIDTASREREVR